MDILNNIVAPSIVATATGGFGYAFAKFQSATQQQKKLNDAPRKYVDHLDRLICQAIDAGGNDAVVRARAIVSARDSMRGSFSSISKCLNTEIDKLAEQVGVSDRQESLQRFPQGQSEREMIFDTMRVLQKVWPSRKGQIEIEVRKLIAELGIDAAVLDERQND